MFLQRQAGIPSCSQGLVYAGKQLDDERQLSSYGIANHSTLTLVLRLRGGKGGFGALLRGLGRDGSKTTNFDACRDLQGRRIRHQTGEEKMKEWQAQAKERELEKVRSLSFGTRFSVAALALLQRVLLLFNAPRNPFLFESARFRSQNARLTAVCEEKHWMLIPGLPPRPPCSCHSQVALKHIKEQSKKAQREEKAQVSACWFREAAWCHWVKCSGKSSCCVQDNYLAPRAYPVPHACLAGGG